MLCFDHPIPQHSFICPYVHPSLFVTLSTVELVQSFTHAVTEVLLVHSCCTLSLIESFMHACIHSFTHSFILSFFLFFMHSSNHSFNQPLIQPTNQPSIHSVIHSSHPLMHTRTQSFVLLASCTQSFLSSCISLFTQSYVSCCIVLLQCLVAHSSMQSCLCSSSFSPIEHVGGPRRR